MSLLAKRRASDALNPLPVPTIRAVSVMLRLLGRGQGKGHRIRSGLLGARLSRRGPSRSDEALLDLCADEPCYFRASALAAALAGSRSKPRYEVVIVGAGGHGLATAYYLA